MSVLWPKPGEMLGGPRDGEIVPRERWGRYIPVPSYEKSRPPYPSMHSVGYVGTHIYVAYPIGGGAIVYVYEGRTQHDASRYPPRTTL